MHIEACLATEYMHRVWRQVNLIFIPPPGKVNYTRAKAYYPITLLTFMHRTIKKLVTTNIKDIILGHVSYISNNLSTN